MNSTEMTLYDANGRRKYLVESEFKAFLAAAETLPPRERAYCHTLAHTGGRLAEIIALRKQDIDLKAGSIVIKSLKKRGKTVYRSIPVPPSLITTLTLVFDLGRGKGGELLWNVDERTANRWIMKAMEAAGVEHTPRSLRHTFGVTAVVKGIPATIIQKWLGHADIKTTAIYMQAMGAEERGLAERMWK